ncbi:hypothetical protein I302_102254 [Kwoniella bestiolae CBS 10118]|uniref:BRCT domain-containing protein n=1 Tax=Kwoniella bestiolae CBS 10118 TaxID=1296100 RepID=A0A1B9GEK2_9TREE|nr:hypothetical protein I302_00943 [Kwoniella bestiolae CBS 10118]OCF29438.1 hypothetical protein I302_00943 [Kwoniella bestiolae CBS 10118]
MENLLYGESIIFAEGQFTDELVEILSERIIELGGTTTSQREGSTILLANPSHPSYKQELDHITYLRRTYPDIPQPNIQPYHWIANIYHSKRLLPIEQLPIISPLFVYPTKLDNNRPIKVWVSVNVSREEGESPEQARDALLGKLECAGAIGVVKRATADLLVVDESSAFAKKVYEERKRYGRDWQKIVERDWVDTCLRNRRLEWKIQDKKKGEKESDEESFVEDETAQMKRDGGKGPGRPAGGPRNEYTPQDDDFLCRYLAAHHPTGSWGSRKTYENLFASVGQYPIAERHSGQSWHERFKKNHVQFEKRVRYYVQGGIDRRLRTKSERDKATAKPTQNDPNLEHAIPPTTQAGPSRPTVTPPVASSSWVYMGKTNLVDLFDEESPPPIQSSTKDNERQARTQNSTQANPIPGPSAIPAVHAPEKPQKPEVPPPVASTNTIDPQSGPSNPSVLPQLDKTASTATDDESLLNDLIPDESQIPARTFASRNVGHQASNHEMTSKDALISRNQERRNSALPLSHSGSLTDTNDEHESQKGEATQAILADFAKAQAAATQQQIDGNDQTSKSVRIDEEATTIVPPETDSAPNLDVRTSAPEPSSNTSTPRRRPPNIQSSQSSPVQIILSPPKRSTNEPASQPIQPDSSADGRPSTSDSARMSLPFQLEVNIRAIPAEQAEPQPVNHQPPLEPQKAIEAGPSAEISTPQRISDIPDSVSGSSRNKRKSLLQEHLTSSATKRRQTQERISRRASTRKSYGLHNDDEEDGDEPDMVLRETSIPPRPIRITPSIPTSPSIQSVRAPSPPLSVQEKNERYLRGKELMDRNIQAYKDRVLALSKRFGMPTGQVFAFINERKGRGSSGERYWEEIERALRERK